MINNRYAMIPAMRVHKTAFIQRWYTFFVEVTKICYEYLYMIIQYWSCIFFGIGV